MPNDAILEEIQSASTENTLKLLNLPDELLLCIIDLMPYDEATRAMMRLSKTCVRLANLFQPKLEERAARVLLTDILHGKPAAALKMIAINPTLAFIEAQAEEYAAGLKPVIDEAGEETLVAVHRKVTASPLRALAGLRDWDFLTQILPFIDKAIDKESDKTGRQLTLELLEPLIGGQHRTNGSAYPLSQYNFNPLVNAITHDLMLMNTEHPNEGTKAILAQFRADFLPTEVVTSGDHFNLNHLLKAFKIYDEIARFWNGNQSSFFWCQVIGYLQRLVPAHVMQAFCQGLGKLLKNNRPLTRSFKLHNWVSSQDIEVYPLDLDPATRLGVDFAADIHGARGPAGGACRKPGAGSHSPWLEKYVEQTLQALTTLRSSCETAPKPQSLSQQPSMR